jgi:hypothetical protein
MKNTTWFTCIFELLARYCRIIGDTFVEHFIPIKSGDMFVFPRNLNCAGDQKVEMSSSCSNRDEEEEEEENRGAGGCFAAYEDHDKEA